MRKSVFTLRWPKQQKRRKFDRLMLMREGPIGDKQLRRILVEIADRAAEGFPYSIKIVSDNHIDIHLPCDKGEDPHMVELHWYNDKLDVAYYGEREHLGGEDEIEVNFSDSGSIEKVVACARRIMKRALSQTRRSSK